MPTDDTSVVSSMAPNWVNWMSQLMMDQCEGDAADKATMIDYSKTRANKR